MEGVEYRVPWRSRDPVLKQGIVSLRLFLLGSCGFLVAIACVFVCSLFLWCFFGD